MKQVRQSRRRIFSLLPPISAILLIFYRFLFISTSITSTDGSSGSAIAAAVALSSHQQLVGTTSSSHIKMSLGSAAGPVLGVKGLSTWAVVGDVLNTAKPAFRVAQQIESSGRTTYRVSPYAKTESLSPAKKVYKTFQDIPLSTKIDAVNLVVSPRIGVQVLEEMAKRDIQYCFVQPGADGGDVLPKAKELGITVEQGCVLVQPLPPLDE